MKERLLREEEGFTLSEMMVTMMIMIIVLFALYSIFDMSVRLFSLGNDKTEAVENARLGLEKMEREVRAAYPLDKANSKTHLFWNQGSPATVAMPTESQITFGNDLNGNRAIVPNSTSVGGTLDNKEEITYLLSGTTLQRRTNSGGTYATQPVVEFVQDVDATDGETNPLTFTYCKVYDPSADGADDTDDDCPAGFDVPSSASVTTNENNISLIRITLDVAVDRGIQEGPATQTLTTDVALKNRGE